ncbi:MAG: TonB-dependent receptor [Bacteroidia bacterium]|nr:MAG: TonB-dependent receptor [Bacteroidia bacterium]
MKPYLLFLLLLYAPSVIYSQNPWELKGQVFHLYTHEPLEGVKIRIHQQGTYSDEQGSFTISHIIQHTDTLYFSCIGFKDTFYIVSRHAPKLKAFLQPVDIKFEEVLITANNDYEKKTFGVQRLTGIHHFTLYEGKKNEVIDLSEVTANLALNNTRQVMTKLPGANIIENDGAGIQLSIGVRGLNPNRIAEFNTRQNGYDISADALGYPETYYTPPLQMVEKIEIIRGAGSLQYGPQFGGLMNFVMKKAPKEKKITLETQQTYGSFHTFASFQSISGTLQRFSYYSAWLYKQGNGFREYSQYRYLCNYNALEYRWNEKLKIHGEITYMNYLMQQPGGLTDAQFAQNPRQAVRTKNWFTTDWFIANFQMQYDLNAHHSFLFNSFGMIAQRASLGNLIPPNQNDYKDYRTLLKDNYKNWGIELKYKNAYKIQAMKAMLLTGIRAYHGNTYRKQGYANNSSHPDFYYLNPENLENSDFILPSYNFAAFAENIIFITPKWSITPGFRWEWIQTEAHGYYRVLLRPEKFYENKILPRSFPLFGVGTNFYITQDIQIYGNISQNYAGINFNDLRVTNPNFQVDPNLQDIKGYNADIGFRGNYKNILSFDVSWFYLNYKNRIGTLLKVDDQFNIIRLRTNIADSRNYGIENYIAWNILKTFWIDKKWDITLFESFSWIEAYYLKSPFKSVQGKRVEFVPQYTSRTGIQWIYKKFRFSLQYTLVTQQYTDATNAQSSPTGITGIIPAYSVWDASASFIAKKWLITLTNNNILNTMYFTRRAEGYPGPGILPSDGRAFYLTLGLKL